MKKGERVMRFDSVPYDIQERIRIADKNARCRRIDSAGKKRKTGAGKQSGAEAARGRMIDRYTGKAEQQPLTPGRAYELFTAGTGAEDARQRMIDRRRKKQA